jgi:recombinational DNA repair ATPase RecF
MYFDSIDFVKTTYHRDYAQIFFTNLSPTFLGKQEHLEKFIEIRNKVLESRPDDAHFLGLLSNEIEKLEEIIMI